MTSYHLEMKLDDTLYRFQIQRIKQGQSAELEAEQAIINAMYTEDSTDQDFFMLNLRRMFALIKIVTSVAEQSTDNGET